MEETRKKKVIFALVALVFVVVAVSIGFIIYNSRFSATLDLLVAPSSATVTVNGKTYKSGEYKLEPGSYEVVISKDGFETKNIKAELIAGKTTMVYDYIMPSDGNFDWYRANNDEMMLLNTIGDRLAVENSRAYTEKNPIVTVLPIIFAEYDKEWNYTEFRIDGGSYDGCEKEFCLKIKDTTGGNEEKAKQLIRDKGFNPDNYEIIYEYTPIEPLK